MELARRELIPYVERVHKPPLPTAPHHREWVDAIEHPFADKPHTLIIAPPGSAKSSWFSKFAPCHIVGRDPGAHVGVIASTARRAYKLSLAVRDTVTDNPEYREVFPGAKPNRSKGWARDQWFLQRTRTDDPDPTMTTCGLFGDLLGSRLEYLFMDDVFDEEVVYSETLRTRGRNWIRNTAMTRLDPSMGRAFCVLTRWSGVTADLVAEFEKDPLWTVIRMPAIGYWGNADSLWKERIPLPFLSAEKRRDPATFEAVYQGNPTIKEGNLFKRDWWVFMDPEDWPAKFERIIQAWDTAYKKNKKSDYSSCVTIGLYKGILYVLNVTRDKWEWPDLVKNANQQYAAYHPREVLIEDSASGQSLIQSLKDQSDPMIPVHPSIRGQQDKRSFVEPITGFCSGRRVVLPKGRDWVQPFVNRMADFHPEREMKDDDTLAFAHAVRYLTKNAAIALTDDCMVIVPASADHPNVAQGFTQNLGVAGGTGGPHWFDNAGF